jgi:hypothetical protein
MPAVVLPKAARAAAAPKVEARKEPEAKPREPDTVETPSPSEAATEELREPEGDAPAGKHFSETAWFMAATDIETLEEVDEDVDVSALEGKYVTEGRHPTGVRKKFSLTMTNLPADPREVAEEPSKKSRKP